MRARKQSGTANPILFFMADSTDHITGKTGLVPVVTLSKNGGAFGPALGAVAEVGNGWYSLAGNATDRNTVGELAIHAAVALADPYDGLVLITPLDPTDGVAFGMTALPAAAFQAAGGLDTDITHTGTAQAGAAATITLASTASALDGTYGGSMIKIVSGTGVGQTRAIIGYVGSTKIASVSRGWSVNPDNTSVYVVVAGAWPSTDGSFGVTLQLTETQRSNIGVAQAGAAATITLASAASAIDNTYVGQLVRLYAGTGSGQVRTILSYVGSTKVATVDRAWATNPDSTTSYSVLAASSPALNSSLQPVAASVAGAVGGNVGGNVVGSVGSLAAQAQTDVESALTAQGLTTARAAKLDDLDATITSRMATFVYTAPDNADIATILTDVAAILARVDVTLSTRLATLGYTAPDNADIATVLTDVGTLLTRIDVTLSTRLASGDYTAPANPDVSALAHLDVDVSTRLAAVDYTAPDNADVAAIKVVTDALPAFPLDPASNTHVDAEVGTAVSFLGGTIADTQNAITAEIDTRLASSDYVAPTNPDVSALAHLDVDVSTRLAGADYVAPQNPDVSALELLDVAVSTRLASGDYTAPDNQDVEAIRAWIAGLTEPVSLDLESAVGVDGSVKVRRGDSYTTGSKHGPLVWPGTATVWGAYVGVASVFTARDPSYRGRSFALEAIFEDMGEGVIQCRVELPSLATGSLSDQSIEEPWDFDVQATEDTLVDVTPIFGSFTILKDVTPPSVG